MKKIGLKICPYLKNLRATRVYTIRENKGKITIT
jgi:hypothetical protein